MPHARGAAKARSGQPGSPGCQPVRSRAVTTAPARHRALLRVSSLTCRETQPGAGGPVAEAMDHVPKYIIYYSIYIIYTLTLHALTMMVNTRHPRRAQPRPAIGKICEQPLRGPAAQPRLERQMACKPP
jgi:hypothetical protein